MHCDITSTKMPSSIFPSNHDSGPPILSYLDPLAALVIKFGRL